MLFLDFFSFHSNLFSFVIPLVTFGSLLFSQQFALTMDLPDLLIGLLQKTAKSSICPPSDLISEVVAVIDTQDSSEFLFFFFFFFFFLK